MGIFESISGILIAGALALVSLISAFFYGSKKGKDKVRQEVNEVESARRDREAEAYRKAVEGRQKTENDVKELKDDELDKELKEWVDYHPDNRK